MKDLLLQVDPLQFKEASPFGTAIYGLLVLALIVAVIFLWLLVNKKDAQYKELAEKALVVMTEVKGQMSYFSEHGKIVINKLDDILNQKK
jgi:hypothetical protein